MNYHCITQLAKPVSMTLMLIVGAFVLLLTVTLSVAIANENREKKILGIYSQPGKWFYLKYCIIWAFQYIRQFLLGLRKNDTNLGTVVQGENDHLDTWKPLSSHIKAFDAVFFQGVDNTNGYFLCGGIERRHNNKVNAVFYIVVPGIGLLRSEYLPKTSQCATNPEKENVFEGGGIRIEMISPMKLWRISYNGKMWLDTPTNLMDVKLDAEWTSNNLHFMFDTDISKRLIAAAIAREPWSSEFFLNLKRTHQNHYEQMGDLKGILTVNGTPHKLRMASFRDHSYGNKRDWTLMHRYIFHMLYLDDNTRICIGVISQQCTTSQLQMGYVTTAKGKIHKITKCNLQLYEHGESGRPPTNIQFSVTANQKRYDCSVTALYECEHFKGNDIEARLVERFIECIVNGTKGRGVAEWQYNNTK